MREFTTCFISLCLCMYSIGSFGTAPGTSALRIQLGFKSSGCPPLDGSFRFFSVRRSLIISTSSSLAAMGATFTFACTLFPFLWWNCFGIGIEPDLSSPDAAFCNLATFPGVSAANPSSAEEFVSLLPSLRNLFLNLGVGVARLDLVLLPMLDPLPLLNKPLLPLLPEAADEILPASLIASLSLSVMLAASLFWASNESAATAFSTLPFHTCIFSTSLASCACTSL
mmetsp:Transcript_5171/g.7895  ORF Transcript_5171/g.7895 Transcript_5171/m.7895 type:complete len:226 (-) Transcript_5171:775-1452(-)